MCQRTWKSRHLSLSSRLTRTGGTSAGAMRGIGCSPRDAVIRPVNPLCTVFLLCADRPSVSAYRCSRVAIPPEAPDSNRGPITFPQRGGCSTGFRSSVVAGLFPAATRIAVLRYSYRCRFATSLRFSDAHPARLSGTAHIASALGWVIGIGTPPRLTLSPTLVRFAA